MHGTPKEAAQKAASCFAVIQKLKLKTQTKNSI